MLAMERSMGSLSTPRTINAVRQPAARPRVAACSRRSLRCFAGEGDMMGQLGGDIGARDPTAGEIESNFGDKVLGNYNTEHIIKPPDAIGDILGLRSKHCSPSAALLDQVTVNRLRQQCPGWRVDTNAAGLQCLKSDFTARSNAAALDMITRFEVVAEAEGHLPVFQVTDENQLAAELTTPSAGGLTENDFIMATKMNELEMGDLLAKKKPKFWA